jgi:hypothetical protein
MWKALFFLLVLTFFPVVGVAVLVSSFGMLRTAGATAQWPTVQGEIVSSKIVTESVFYKGEIGERGQWNDEHSVQIRYEFSVDGENYQAERITLWDAATTDRHQAELTCKEFGKGKTTVYYNPNDPQDALLSPRDVSAAMPGIVIAVLIIIVPPGMILLGFRYDFIEKPELPIYIRLWWDLKFGKYRGSSGDGLPNDSSPEAELTTGAIQGADVTVPDGKDFYENVVQWDLGNRVELTATPAALAVYLGMSVVFGFGVAYVGMIPITYLIFQRDTLHLPELRTVFVVLFVISGSFAFFSMRLAELGSKTVIDWNTRLIRAKRELSFARQYSLSDVRRVVVRCVPVKGRRRRFRAAIDIEVVGGRVTAARTCSPRRKAASAKQKSLRLAEPLAAALHVPVELDGWEE